MSDYETAVYGAADGDRYHATRSCAGQDGDQLLIEFVLRTDMEPCGVCQPPEPALCDECGNLYKTEEWVARHRRQDHLQGIWEPDGDKAATWEALREKSRRAGQ